jgi:hypothetical protein
MNLIKKIFHKPDPKKEMEFDEEMARQENKRREVEARLRAIEVSLPVRRSRGEGHNAT